MKIRVLGAHNCEARNSRLVSLLIDDVLAIDAGGLTSSLSFTAQMKLKAILLTHHHYDHIRDIPAITMNAYLRNKTINVYSIPSVRDVLSTHLLNDQLYPNFFARPHGKPTINYTTMAPAQERQIDGYHVLTVSVGHSVPAVGYQVTAPDGKAVFFAGDSGPDLSVAWQSIAPQLLIIEVTAPNKFEEFARQSGHLTPGLLKQELTSFRHLKGYLPKVVTVHVNPVEQKKIAAEIADVSNELACSITLAAEGMLLHL